jgi:hypothetical protein
MDDLMQESGVEMYHKPCNGDGCEACHQTGVVDITDEFKRLTDRAEAAEQRITDALALLNHPTEVTGCQCLAHRVARVLRGES